MTHPELNLAMTRSRTAELRRRAATPRRAGSTGGTATSLFDAVPLTIRFAGSHDGGALATLAALDSAEPLILPALLAEVHGELRAAISLIDSAAIADPFHPTVELVALLRTRAQQLTAQQGTSWRARIGTPLRIAKALRLATRS